MARHRRMLVLPGLGFGGSMKRGIGSRVMTGQLKKMFESGRTKIGQ